MALRTTVIVATPDESSSATAYALRLKLTFGFGAANACAGSTSAKSTKSGSSFLRFTAGPLGLGLRHKIGPGTRMDNGPAGATSVQDRERRLPPLATA